MKKKIFALFMIGILTFPIAGCGGEKENPETSNGTVSVTAMPVLDDNNVLEVMESANSLDTLLEKYGSITFYVVDRSGRENVVHLKEVEGGYNYYILDATGVEYLSNPQGQYIVTSDGESQAALCESEADYEILREEALASVRSGMYQYNEQEKVSAIEEQEETTTVTSVFRMTDGVAGYSEFKSVWGIDDEEFDYVNVYVLDRETLEIQETFSYCELSTGRVENGTISITYGESIEYSDDLKACMESAK